MSLSRIPTSKTTSSILILLMLVVLATTAYADTIILNDDFSGGWKSDVYICYVAYGVGAQSNSTGGCQMISGEIQGFNCVGCGIGLRDDWYKTIRCKEIVLCNQERLSHLLTETTI